VVSSCDPYESPEYRTCFSMSDVIRFVSST
jgi:hypothetical protein